MEDHTQPDADEVNNRWENVKKAYLKTSKACLGNREKKQNEWITTDMWQAIEKQRTQKRWVMEAKFDRLKERYNLQYHEANRAVRRKTRGDRQKGIRENPCKSGRSCSKQRGAGESVQDLQNSLATSIGEPLNLCCCLHASRHKGSK